MKKSTKSIISLLLTVCLCIGCLPTSLFAVGEQSGSSQQDGEIIVSVTDSQPSTDGASGVEPAGLIDPDGDDSDVYHEVKFMVEGQEWVTQNVKDGETPVLPDNPVKNPDEENKIGYVFKGWTPSITEPVYGPVEYFPVFEEIVTYKLTINYLKDDGTELFPSVVAYYSSAEEFEDTYTSPGSSIWTADKLEVAVDSDTFADTSEVVLDVTYSRTGTYYNVVHCFEDLGGGYDSDRKTVTLTAQLGELVLPAALDVIPEGFEVDHYGDPVELLSKDEDYTVYVYYRRLVNTVLFEVGGGVAIEAKSGKYGSEIEMPSTSRISYTFEGWYSNPEFTGEALNAGDTTTISADRVTTYYAKWNGEEVTYSVVYLVEKPNLGYQPTVSNLNPDDFVKTSVEFDDRKATADSIVTATEADMNYVFTAGNLYGDTNSFAKDVKIASYLCADTKTVSADGSTVVYVYFTLDHFTYVFDAYNSFKRYGDHGDYLDASDAVHLYFKYHNVPSGISGTQENGYYSEIIIHDVHYGENVSDRWPDGFAGNFYVKENGVFVALEDADMSLSLGITQGSFNFDGWRGIMDEPINTTGHNGTTIKGRILCNYNRSGEALTNKWRGCLMVQQYYAKYFSIVEKLTIPADAPRNNTGAEIEFTLEDIAKYTSRYGVIERENQSDLFWDWKSTGGTPRRIWENHVMSHEAEFDPNEDYWLNLNGTSTKIMPASYNWYVSKLAGFDYDEVKTRAIYNAKVLSSSDKYYDAYRVLCGTCSVTNSCGFPWIFGDGRGLETDDTIPGTKTSGYAGKILTYGSGTRLMPFLYNRLDFTLNFVPMLGDELFEEATALNVSYEVPYEAPLSYYEPLDTVMEELISVEINDVKYTFGGWYYDAEYTQPVDWSKDIMPAQGISIFGKWIPETIKITFDHNYPGAPAPETYEIIPGAYMEDQPGFEAEPARENYEFIGWYEDPQNEDHDFAADQGVAKKYNGKTLYAHWKEVKVSYTVRYLERTTNDVLHEAKIVSDNRIGTKVTEEFIAIPGYAVDELEKSITLVADENENIIIFWYETGVTLQYQVIHVYTDANGNNVEIKEDVQYTTDVRVAETAGHKDIPEGYKPTEQVKTLALTLNPENNIIVFEYKPLPEAQYIVHHYYQYSVGQALENYPEDKAAKAFSGDIKKGYSYTAERNIKDGYKIVKILVDINGNQTTRATNRDLHLTVSDAEIRAKVVHIHMYYELINETSVEGAKTWVDNNDQDGKRPENITINLLADGKEIAEVTVSAADGWAWKFTNLPKYRDGNVKIFYTITEDAVENYVTKIDGYNVTNTHVPATVEVEGKKTWNDESDIAGFRPESITINLLADGTEIDDVTVSAADGWAWKFTDLPKYKDHGTKIVYTITEDAVANYTPKIDGYNVTNTHVPERINISGSKTWDDNNNQDGKRPVSITINLLANGTVVDTKTVTEKDGWKWEFNNLLKFSEGSPIKYTLTEDAVDEYTTKIEDFDVTNIYTPTTISFEGSKTWVDADDQDGIRPDSIKINLLADGAVIKTVEVTESDGWAWSFTDLPIYRDGGVEIVYTITEDKVEGYTTEINGFDVTNTHVPATVEVEGKKTWSDNNDQDGIRPENITINLLADGKEIADVTVTAADGWAWKFTNLPKYRDHGVEIVYTMTEDAVEGYTTEINGFDVTNTHVPEVIEIEGSKTWFDEDDQDGKRPESITINLLADGVVRDSIVVTEADGWAWSFTELPKYRDHGTEIVYTITENKVSGYEAKINGYDVTNVHYPEVVEVSGVKIWNDADNQDGKRPESITINLHANGVVVASKIVTEADGWAWNFKMLDKYSAGVEIVYTVSENAVEGYTNEIVDRYSIVNTYAPEKTNVLGYKFWDDNNNLDGIRPEKITVNLYANGTYVTSKVVSEADNWSWNFTNLDKYANGRLVYYTITEDTIPGYTAVIDGYNVTNVHTPETTEVNGSKTWNDADNRDGKRPESIVINLIANGIKVDSKVVTAESGWTWNFTDLAKNVNGKPIAYTVSEEAVPGYTTTVNGYDVVNTYVPEEIAINVTKVWVDDDNFDGYRPESITVHLFADGTLIATQNITEADNWTWTFTGLDKYNGNGAIVYTVVEDSVEHYETTITATENGFIIVNEYLEEIEEPEVPLQAPETSDIGFSFIILALASVVVGCSSMVIRKKK